MSSEGSPSPRTQRRSALPRRHLTAFGVALAALAVSLVGLAISIVQTHLARDDAQEARKTSTYVVESLARKVFIDTDFDSVTVSNIGTQPIRDVTLYRTDEHGAPTAAYEFERSVPGCYSYRWEGPVRDHLAVTFRVVDEGLWLLSDITGLHRLDSDPIVSQSARRWNLASSPIRLCG